MNDAALVNLSSNPFNINFSLYLASRLHSNDTNKFGTIMRYYFLAFASLALAVAGVPNIGCSLGLENCPRDCLAAAGGSPYMSCGDSYVRKPGWKDASVSHDLLTSIL